MNAILREEYEAPVLTVDAIEVHLSHMQPDLAAVKAALPVLRDKIDHLSEKMDSKIDQANRDRAAGNAALGERIDQLSARTEARFDQANKDRADGDAALAEKIDQANKDRADGDAMLAAKIDQANKDRADGDAALAGKIDQLSARVDAKFDQFAARVDAKIDQANKDRVAGDTALAGKIDHLTELVMEIRGGQNGLKWFIGSATVIFGGIALARTLGWI